MSKENGNEPVSAIELNGFGQYAPSVHLGLTKREHVAIEMMKAIISNPILTGSDDIRHTGTVRSMSDRANLIADTLIESWEK